MDNSIFINDLRQELGNLPAVKSPIFKYKEYDVITVNSIKNDIIDSSDEYIIANGLIYPDKSTSDSTIGSDIEIESVVHEDFDILFSLIKLVKNKGYLPKDFQKPHNDAFMPTNDIIEWCYKYGLPFPPTITIPRDLINNKNGEKVEAGFNILHFRFRLGFLYGCFNLWKAINEGNHNDIDEYATFAGITADMKFKNIDEKISAIKRSIPIFAIGSVNLRPAYDAKTDTFNFSIYTKDLFEVAYFQLAILMTKTSKDIKDNFKRCPSCSSMFWGHGNRKYCSNCNRKTIWSRKQKKQAK